MRILTFGLKEDRGTDILIKDIVADCKYLPSIKDGALVEFSGLWSHEGLSVMGISNTIVMPIHPMMVYYPWSVIIINVNVYYLNIGC